MFLWYRREGAALPHDAHVFAFITENFRRMTRPRFMGYGKPVVTARAGTLSVENVPPPKPRQAAPPPAALAYLQNMHLARAIEEIKRRQAQKHSDHWAEQAGETARLIFDELKSLHQIQDRAFVLVYLPIESDYTDNDSDRWRAWLNKHAAGQGCFFFDMVAALRERPEHEIPGLFIQEDFKGYSGARGHYTPAGNQWVTYTLVGLFAAHPELAVFLAPASP
jgi:hypothetical protein